MKKQDIPDMPPNLDDEKEPAPPPEVYGLGGLTGILRVYVDWLKVQPISVYCGAGYVPGPIDTSLERFCEDVLRVNPRGQCPRSWKNALAALGPRGDVVMQAMQSLDPEADG